MKEMETILAGIDYSECSDNALKEASRIANWNNSKLICFHVLEESAIEDLERMVDVDREKVVDESLRRLETHIADTIGAGHDVHCRVTIGYPFKEFIHAIKETGAGTLVIGSRGHCQSNPNRTGAFASRCVRKAPAEVLLVRQHQETPFRKVTACVDFSDTSALALKRAAAIAMQDTAELEVIHVCQSPILIAQDFGGLGPALPVPDLEAIQPAAEKRLAKFVEENMPDDDEVNPKCIVIAAGAAGPALVDHLKDSESDLAVLGTRGRTGILGFFLGTTAERIIHEAHCSTLAIKPAGFKYSI